MTPVSSPAASPVFQWVILPMLILVARIADRSLGTLRTILSARGRARPAALIGFAEIVIWLLIMQQVLGDVSNPLNFLAYAAGFAIGTYVGILLEERIALGEVLVRIVTGEAAADLSAELRHAGYGITVLAAAGRDGPVTILLAIVRRRDLRRFESVVASFSEHAFYTLEDVRYTSRTAMRFTHGPLAAAAEG
jgi:uncharacterized protein YebE (UPF0316 family)